MKKDRHTIIAELIENNVISTQEDLLRMLNAAGVSVTQATVSRDIKQMRIVKQAAPNGVYKYCLPRANADGGNNISALSAKVCLEQQDAYYTSPAFNGSSTARDEVAALLPKCLTIPDDADVDAEIVKAFEEAVAKCEYSL